MVRLASAALGILTALGCSPAPRGEPRAFRPLVVGDTVAVYQAAALGGDSIRIGPGQPLTILNVWATWCSSCREEMSDLMALQREFGPSGARVIGVSVDGGDGIRVRRFAESEKLGFTVAHDPEQRVQALYQVVGVPETFVLDSAGRVLWRRVGNVHPVLDSIRAVVRAETEGR